MIWVDSIYDLAYYNSPVGVPCYCEELVFPNDMQLQGLLSNGRTPYTVTLYVYSPDGLTQYENATTYFQVYTAKSTSNQDYFNARLKSFSPAMCNNKCFIIRAVVTSGGATIFDKYTERYCVSSCCVTAGDIIYVQDGVTSVASTNPIPQLTTQPRSECGTPLIRIISRFDCIDAFTGNFFGDPSVVYSGTADWNYTLVTSCKGRIVRRPRDIRKEISYNCRIQKAESQPTYLLEGYEYFPAWKMYEIEGQLHANHIWVDDYSSYREYVYNGGAAFKKVDGANSCTEIFKLETNIYECLQRQIFGCSEACAGTSTGYLIIPSSYETGSWYDENGQLIATVYDGDLSSPMTAGFLQWLRNQNGITNVEELNLTGTTCESYTYAIVKVETASILPTSVYMVSPTPNNRLFIRVESDESELCDYIGNTPCVKPVLDTAAVITMVCDTPALGTPIITTITPETLTILAITPWVAEAAPDTEASLYVGQVTFSFEGTKIVAASNGDDYTIIGEQVATISGEGWPSVARQLDSTNTSGLTDDQIVVIDIGGIVRVSGTFPITVDNELTLNFDNFLYSL